MRSKRFFTVAITHYIKSYSVHRALVYIHAIVEYVIEAATGKPLKERRPTSEVVLLRRKRKEVLFIMYI